MRDFAVLTVYAAQGTAGEENRTGAAGTGNRGFFPVMRSDPGNEHFPAKAAKTRAGGTVRIALTGAERTAHDDTAFSVC